MIREPKPSFVLLQQHDLRMIGEGLNLFHQRSLNLNIHQMRCWRHQWDFLNGVIHDGTRRCFDSGSDFGESRIYVWGVGGFESGDEGNENGLSATDQWRELNILTFSESADTCYRILTIG